MKRGDTPPDHGKNLCDTCNNATIIRGHAASQILVNCGAISFGSRRGMVPFPVSSCTAYEPRQTLSLHEMERMAYVLENKDGKYGFRRLSKEERHDLYSY